jgi:hypothetical protein
MKRDQLKPNAILTGPIFPEPVQVSVAVPLGEAVKVVAKGLRTGQVHEPVLNTAQLSRLPEKEPFHGDPHKFRLGVEAMRPVSEPAHYLFGKDDAQPTNNRRNWPRRVQEPLDEANIDGMEIG